MQTFVHYFSISLSLLVLLCSAQSHAASDGIIHFTGQIVESPCDYQANARQVSVSCFEEGKARVKTVNVRDLFQGRKLTNAKTTASLQWVNPEKSLAILTVEYQ
ncbi:MULTISPECIES: hypothetical protein [Kluyvera]|uniref:hypothetical protein n=1 Tax=Kluyvera sp. CHPC 1.2972 TaxID=2995176 RepID=UPI002FD7B27B